MISKSKQCCKDCTKRYLGCHDHCESYKEYKKEIDEANKKRQEAIHENSHFVDKKYKALKIMRQKGRL